MDDLISREAALRTDCFGDGHEGLRAFHSYHDYRKMREYLESLPTIDAVPVVRCKDCVHFHYDKPYVIQGIPVLGHEVCDFWGDGCWTSENGFCSYAERRTDED